MIHALKGVGFRTGDAAANNYHKRVSPTCYAHAINTNKFQLAANGNTTMEEDFARLELAVGAAKSNTDDKLTQASKEAKPETTPQLATHPNEAEESTDNHPQTGFLDLPFGKLSPVSTV